MMDVASMLRKLGNTPAFVLDQTQIFHNASLLAEIAQQCGCKPLYSIKALPFVAAMQWIKPYVAGFSVSSLFEANLAQEVLAGGGDIHLTTPGIRANEMDALTQCCTHISFNSLNQWQHYAGVQQHGVSFGLRVNPQLSFMSDARYDPCGAFSKLGVSLAMLRKQGLPPGVRGLHFHTVFSAQDFTPLLQTVALLRQHFSTEFNDLQWLNLGGGYLFDAIADYQPFITLVNALRDDYGLDVYIEPGNALVGNAGYLVSSVVDCFSSEGKILAVLDSSVNHLPRVFEFQISPELLIPETKGNNRVTLVGSTCLAGDVFGEYACTTPLTMGSRVVFGNVGAYSMVKASRFNGYNLPDIYAWNGQELVLLKQYDYQDYRQQWLS